MKTLPAIGSRVRFSATAEYLGTREATGVVVRFYKTYIYPDDADWENKEVIRPIGVAPVSEWHVSVKVDTKPKWWPYGDSDTFAPLVEEVEPI